MPRHRSGMAAHWGPTDRLSPDDLSFASPQPAPLPDECLFCQDFPDPWKCCYEIQTSREGDSGGSVFDDFALVAGFLVFFIVTVGMCLHRLWYDTYLRRFRHSQHLRALATSVGRRVQGQEDESELPLIVYVDIKHKLAFPLNLSSTPRNDTLTTNGVRNNRLLEESSASSISTSSSAVGAMHAAQENTRNSESVNITAASSQDATAPALLQAQPSALAAGARRTVSLNDNSSLSVLTNPLHQNANMGSPSAPLSPLTVLAIMRARRSSGSALHSLPQQYNITPHGVAESQQRRRRASLPGPCAVTEGVMLHERVPSSSQTHSNSSSHGSEHAYAAVGGYRAVSCSGVETGMQGQGVAESRVAAEWHLPLLMSNWIGAGSRPKASVESGQEPAGTTTHSARSHASAASNTTGSSTKADAKSSGVMSRILEGIFGPPTDDAEITKVLKNESEKQSAHVWFDTLDEKSMPLLAVMPNGEICVCWNSSHPDDDEPGRVSEPVKHQENSTQDSTSAQHQGSSALVEVVEESTTTGTAMAQEPSEAIQMHAIPTRFSPSDAGSAPSSSIFLNVHDYSGDVPATHTDHPSESIGTGTLTQAQNSTLDGTGRPGNKEAVPVPALRFPVHRAARSGLPPPPSSGTQSNVSQSLWLWATPFSGVQRALSSLWLDSTSQMDSTQRGTERGWLQENDIELSGLQHLSDAQVIHGSCTQNHEVEARACDNISDSQHHSDARSSSGTVAENRLGNLKNLSIQTVCDVRGSSDEHTAPGPESKGSSVKTGFREQCHSAHSSTPAWQGAGSSDASESSERHLHSGDCKSQYGTVESKTKVGPLDPGSLSKVASATMEYQLHAQPSTSRSFQKDFSRGVLTVEEGLRSCGSKAATNSAHRQRASQIQADKLAHATASCCREELARGDESGACSRQSGAHTGPACSLVHGQHDSATRESLARMQRQCGYRSYPSSPGCSVTSSASSSRTLDSHAVMCARWPTESRTAEAAAAEPQTEPSNINHTSVNNAVQASTAAGVPGTSAGEPLSLGDAVEAALVRCAAVAAPSDATPEADGQQTSQNVAQNAVVAPRASEYQAALTDLEAISAQAQSSSGESGGGVGTFYIYRLELTSDDFRHVCRTV